MSTLVLETLELSKRYGRQSVVDSASIAAREGEVFGLLGPNGAGKTTILGMALGLVHPTGGEVRVFGERVTPHRLGALRQVGAMLGAPALVPRLTARENLALMARLTPGITARRIADALDMVGLFEAASRPVKALSTGVKQRIGLALALLNRPRFLIVDEPTNGLDPAGMREIRHLLRTLVHEGMTVLLSSHLLNEVQQVCDRIAVLNHGRVVAQGLLADLLRARQTAIMVRVEDPDSAAQVLRTLQGVRAVNRENGHLLVSGVDNEAVMRCLVGHGLLPIEVTTRTDDLESLFLAATA